MLGLTRERVRQIKDKAIGKLRENSRSKLLKHYLGSIIISEKPLVVGSKSEKGKIAEDAACDFLITHNYRILERNWRFKKAEIDIIAEDT